MPSTIYHPYQIHFFATYYFPPYSSSTTNSTSFSEGEVMWWWLWRTNMHCMNSKWCNDCQWMIGTKVGRWEWLESKRRSATNEQYPRGRMRVNNTTLVGRWKEWNWLWMNYVRFNWRQRDQWHELETDYLDREENYNQSLRPKGEFTRKNIYLVHVQFWEKCGQISVNQ